MKYYLFDLHRQSSGNVFERYYCCFEGGRLLWVFSRLFKSFMSTDPAVFRFFQEVIGRGGEYLLCEDNEGGAFFYTAKETIPELFLEESEIPFGVLFTIANEKIRYWAKAYAKNK